MKSTGYNAGGKVAVLALFAATTLAVAQTNQLNKAPAQEIHDVRVIKKDLAGDYYNNVIELTLKPNGKYSANSEHSWGKDGESSGKWTLTNNTVIFTPKHEKGKMKGKLQTFDVRRLDNTWFLVPPAASNISTATSFRKIPQKFHD